MRTILPLIFLSACGAPICLHEDITEVQTNDIFPQIEIELVPRRQLDAGRLLVLMNGLPIFNKDVTLRESHRVYTGRSGTPPAAIDVVVQLTADGREHTRSFRVRVRERSRSRVVVLLTDCSE